MTTRRRTPLRADEVEAERCNAVRRERILARVPFFAGLDPAEIRDINTLFREHGYEPGETIYFTGDPARLLCVVAAGKVKLIRHTLSGQDVITDILAEGEFFGTLAALGDEHYPDTAQAQTACCVLAIAAADFQRLLERYPPIALRLLPIVAGRLLATQEQVRQLSAHSVESRIAAVLLLLADKLGEPRDGQTLIQMPLSRQDLAAMTGATTETVSRVLSSLKRHAQIDSGRQWIAIVDRPALEELAATGGPAGALT